MFFIIILSACANGCTEDRRARLGLSSLWRTVRNPFHAHSFDRLKAELLEDPPRFSFVVFGNTDLASGGSSDPLAMTTLDLIMADIRSLSPQPRFIFHLGDVAEKPGDVAVWRDFIRKVEPFEIGLGDGILWDLNRKWVFVLPGDRDLHNKKNEADFLKCFPRPSGDVPFSFGWEDFHFIALNSETIDDGWLMKRFGFNREQNRIRGPQWNWLESDLLKNQGKNIVVFIHKPLFPPVFSRHEGYCMDQHYFDRRRLMALLESHSVRVVFMGHEAIFHWARIQGSHHIISGGAGRKPRSGRWLGGFHHFLYVTIYEDRRMEIYCVDPEHNSVEARISVP
jgi:hypothetical protein